MVDASGEMAFFASDREGGYGGLDIYYFELPRHLRANKTLYFEGTVFDAVSKKPIPGQFQLIDLSTGEEVIFAEADAITGEFTVTLPINSSFALNVSYPNYSFYSSNFDMTVESGQETVKMDIPLVPFKSGASTVLNNVFFDVGKAVLRNESYVELNKLRDFMESNPTLSIEISGHTDSRGDQELNIVLSNNRAKAVREYLISKGVRANRMTSVGYGSKKPRITNETIEALQSEQEKEAAHQSNRRTEYKIVTQ